MEYKGSSVYEHKDFFENYMKRRHRKESPNIVIELPALLNMMGNIENQRILDIGCGDASLGEMLLQNKGNTYTGVDGSESMCQKAKESLGNHPGCKILQSSIEDFDFETEVYDLVVSQLALHYIEDLQSAVNRIFSCLKQGGRFIFSVQHPLLTSSAKSMQSGGPRSDWIVDDYYHTGKRVEPWIGAHVVKYHRTMEDYFSILQQAGFKINGMSEARPLKENFDEEAEYERRMRIPLFLLFSCVK
ncbi:class I SAM-dependent methyltransferase [Bacillus mesophilum]|uniref:Class I SAM-dependent methyltransferase n=1 Tax=Bacillus mesophilum TaxID=1071718 RepID=A0A7V7RK91_9BACI|nr:class I SAM-dependent methyltransferase [Bacillus mesophilum]KAB2331672.1 class I SAM-dependent methyltransferase [Bacillus mesophilum]